MRKQFLSIFATPGDYIERQKAWAEVKSASQTPHISIVGAIDDVNEIYVDFDNLSYKVDTFARAIDVCFKAFYVINIQSRSVS